MTKTTNYQLNQWAKTDRLMMEDFNADNAKIDAALGALQIVTGTYTGSGNDANCRVDVALGFRPKAVLVMANKYQFSGSGGAFFALAVDTEDAADNGYLELTDTGFAAKSTLATGDSDRYYSRNPFRYIAWH